jgi:hypothetical protein
MLPSDLTVLVICIFLSNPYVIAAGATALATGGFTALYHFYGPLTDRASKTIDVPQVIDAQRARAVEAVYSAISNHFADRARINALTVTRHTNEGVIYKTTPIKVKNSLEQFEVMAMFSFDGYAVFFTSLFMVFIFNAVVLFLIHNVIVKKFVYPDFSLIVVKALFYIARAFGLNYVAQKLKNHEQFNST